MIAQWSKRHSGHLLVVLSRESRVQRQQSVMVFNGTNSDPSSKEVYRRWIKVYEGTDRISGSPAADVRAALVESFRDEVAITIATEAASEGINLQSCDLVVN